MRARPPTKPPLRPPPPGLPGGLRDRHVAGWAEAGLRCAPRARRGCAQREAAGVAAKVQYALATQRQATQPRAIVALVTVEASFLPQSQVDAVRKAALLDLDLVRWLRRRGVEESICGIHPE